MPEYPAMTLIKSHTLYADGHVTVSKAPVQCGYELDYVSMCRHSICNLFGSHHMPECPAMPLIKSGTYTHSIRTWACNCQQGTGPMWISIGLCKHVQTLHFAIYLGSATCPSVRPCH